MSFIVIRRAISQAGRRRFEPGLPLHLFNHLGRSSKIGLCDVVEQHEYGWYFAQVLDFDHGRRQSIKSVSGGDMPEILLQGSRGEEVRRLQRNLNEA